MANKRIELEQYKCYVNLLEEDPNRKSVRQGMTFAMAVSILLAVLMLVLGLLSNSLTGISNGVLQKPPGKAPSTSPQTPTGIPGQVPSQQLPSGVPQVPTNVPSPSPIPGGALPSNRILSDAAPPALGAKGALLAQTTTTVPAQGSQPIQIAPGSTGQLPSSAANTKKANPGPPKETKGVGNLSNLAKGAGGRGFQIYMLVLCIALAILLFTAMLRARKEGKAK